MEKELSIESQNKLIEICEDAKKLMYIDFLKKYQPDLIGKGEREADLAIYSMDFDDCWNLEIYFVDFSYSSYKLIKK